MYSGPYLIWSPVLLIASLLLRVQQYHNLFVKRNMPTKAKRAPSGVYVGQSVPD